MNARMLTLIMFIFSSLRADQARIKRDYFADTTTVQFTAITFPANVTLSRQELWYLLGFRPGQPVTHADLAHARKRFESKKRFVSVDFAIEEEDGLQLRIMLEEAWLLRSVSVKGILFGRDRFRSLYLQQPGEIFDVEAHEESLRVMIQQMHDDGYCAARAEDMVHYNNENKSLHVSVTLQPGARFSITDVAIYWDGSDDSCVSDASLAQIEQRFVARVQGHHYSKKYLRFIKKKIIAALQAEGYANARVHLKRRVRSDGVELRVRIKPGKKVSIHFVGNSVLTSDYLTRMLITDQPAWLLTPDVIAEQVTHLYRSNGYKEVHVSHEETETGSVIIHIHEGEPIIIERVRIVDEQGRQLDDFAALCRGVRGDVLSDAAYMHLMQAVERSCLEQGFVECSVTSSRRRRGHRVVVTLVCNRGKRHVITHHTLTGVSTELEDELRKKVFADASHDRAFQHAYLWQLTQAVREVLYKKGYWYAHVKPQATVVASDESVCQHEVVWNIVPGQSVVQGSVIVQGTTRLSFAKIRSELPVSTGKRWDPAVLTLAHSRLKALNIFKNIRVQPYDVATPEEVKDIVVWLDDDYPYEFRVRAGYFLTSKNFLFRRQSTYKFGGQLLVKNPTNGADMLKADGEITRFERTINVEYQRPRFCGSSILSSLKVYTYKYTHPLSLGESEAAYETAQHGLLAGLSNQYKKDYHWGCSTGIEWMRTSRVRGNLNLATDLINRTLPYYFLEPTLIIDGVDDRIEPSLGGLTFCSIKLMVPVKSGITTYRALIEQSLFYPLARSIIGAVKFRWGHIFRRNFNRIMPHERFYLGGAHSVRGYEKDAMPPLGVTCCAYPDGSTRKEFTIQGGSSMLSVNLELRMRVWPTLSVVLFHDLGVLSQAGMAPLDGDWLPASGFGMRFHTPIGPLRFDVARKWKKDIPEQSSVVWYLTLGHIF